MTTTGRWATVVLTAPLRIQFDTAPDVHPVTPQLLVAPSLLRPGVRVWTEMRGSDVFIFGIANGSEGGGSRQMSARNLTNFTAAWADRGNRPCKVAVLGDSIMEGWDSDTPTARRRAQGLLADAINGGRARGDGWLPAVYTSNHLAAEGTFSTTPADGADLWQDNSFGLGLRALGMKNGAWREWTFTGDRVRIHFWQQDFAGSNAEVEIDGVAVATLDGIGTPAPQWWTSAPLTRGQHTVRVTSLDASGFVFFLEAAQVYDGDYSAGAQVLDGAHAGFTAEWFTGFNERWIHKLVQLEPALVVIALGTNDAVTYDSQQFDDHLAIMTFKIEHYLAAIPHSLCFVSAPNRTIPYEPISPWSRYVAANRRMAAAFGGHHVDLGAWWRPELTSGDGTHPTPQGQRIIAAALAAELGV